MKSAEGGEKQVEEDDEVSFPIFHVKEERTVVRTEELEVKVSRDTEDGLDVELNKSKRKGRRRKKGLARVPSTSRREGVVSKLNRSTAEIFKDSPSEDVLLPDESRRYRREGEQNQRRWDEELKSQGRDGEGGREERRRERTEMVISPE